MHASFDRAGSEGWLTPWRAAAEAPGVLHALVGAAEAQARLETRLAHDPACRGAEARLALAETAEVMWLAGDAGARDRLALYAHGRQGAIDARDLRAGWALRRLQRAGDPAAMEVDQLRAFLGLRRGRQGAAQDWVTDQAGLFARPAGDELDEALALWRAMAGQLTAQHRLVRAAILHRAWRWLGLSGPDDPVTPLIVALRIGGAGRRAPGFAPLASAARRRHVFAVTGPETARLAATLSGFAEAAAEALLMLERLALWHARAADMPRTRAMRAVIAAAAAAPVVSTGAIAQASGLTGQAVNRAARHLHAHGLIREATGQARYRLWAAAV